MVNPVSYLAWSNLFYSILTSYSNVRQYSSRRTSREDSWWINELDSLGVDTKSNSNELKDKQENQDLVEAIKQEFIEEYKQTHDHWYFLFI